MKRMSASFLTVALVLGGIGQAKADLGVQFSGTIYENAPGAAANPLVTTNPGGPQSTFTTAPNGGFSINLIAPVGNTPYTPNGFLNVNGGTLNQTGSGGFDPNGTLDQTFLLFTATVTSFVGQVFTFTTLHDDGIQLKVGAMTFPGTGDATGNETYSYTATGASTQITLAYGETHGQPARLQLGITATATPEPATLTMAGCGLVAFVGYKLRRKRVLA